MNALFSSTDMSLTEVVADTLSSISSAPVTSNFYRLFDSETWELIEIEFQNEGYIARQELMINRTQAMEDLKLPKDIDYNDIGSLKKEAKARLNEIKPNTLGQASRISGITPADIAVISIWIKKDNISH